MVKLFEYMGKELFRRYDIPVPAGEVVDNAAAAAAAVAKLSPAAVLKAQVLSGKRGKAGGLNSRPGVKMLLSWLKKS